MEYRKHKGYLNLEIYKYLKKIIINMYQTSRNIGKGFFIISTRINNY